MEKIEQEKTEQSKKDAISYKEIEKKNPYFEYYYKHIYQLYWNKESNYNEFLESLKTSLPSSFRVNSNLPYYEKFINYFESNTFLKEIMKDEKKESNPDADVDD